MTTMHKKQSGDKTYRKHFFFRQPVQKLCSSCLFSGKALDDLLIKVRDVSDEFLLHGEHSQSIKTILCHGVSQESLDPFQKQKSTSWIQLLSEVWWGESWENWMCMWKCSVGCSWWKKNTDTRHSSTMFWKQLFMLNAEEAFHGMLQDCITRLSKIHDKIKYALNLFRCKKFYLNTCPCPCEVYES